MDLINIFKKNLIYFRKKENLTQENLAELTDLHQTYISDLERGIRNPSLLTIEKIAKSLKITPDSLLKKKSGEFYGKSRIK